MMSHQIETAVGRVCLHKQGFHGRCQDFTMTFNEDATTIEEIIGRGYNMFERLMENYDLDCIKVRFIARVQYTRHNDRHEVVGHETYHFASYQAERIDDLHDFYARHMLKIASRMDQFHQNGSRLTIDKIERLHICITQCRLAASTEQ